MKLLKTQIHFVKIGENLADIAQKYGFSDWKKLYSAPVNEGFRKMRPNPNQIRPGDKIFIPADAKVVAAQLRSRLGKLQKVRMDTVELMNQVESDLRREYGKAKSTAETVDAVALVTGILVGQAGLVKNWKRALKLSGDDLARLNRQIVRDHFLSPTTGNIATVTGLVGSVFDEPNETDGVLIAFGKDAIKFWADMWSPSYWAAKFVGKTPEQALNESLDQINKNRRNFLSSLDQRIQKNRTLLKHVEKEGL